MTTGASNFCSHALNVASGYPSRRHFEAHPRSPAGTRRTGTARRDREVSKRTGLQYFHWSGNTPRFHKRQIYTPSSASRPRAPLGTYAVLSILTPRHGSKGSKRIASSSKLNKEQTCGLQATIGAVPSVPPRAGAGPKEAGRVNRWQKSNNRSLSDCPVSWRPRVGRMATMYKHLVDPRLCATFADPSFEPDRRSRGADERRYAMEPSGWQENEVARLHMTREPARTSSCVPRSTRDCLSLSADVVRRGMPGQRVRHCMTASANRRHCETLSGHLRTCMGT